jgi:hypothetical protein
MLKFDVNFYENDDEWKASRNASESDSEVVRF